MDCNFCLCPSWHFFRRGSLLPASCDGIRRAWVELLQPNLSPSSTICIQHSPKKSKPYNTSTILMFQVTVHIYIYTHVCVIVCVCVSLSKEIGSTCYHFNQVILPIRTFRASAVSQWRSRQWSLHRNGGRLSQTGRWHWWLGQSWAISTKASFLRD